MASEDAIARSSGDRPGERQSDSDDDLAAYDERADSLWMILVAPTLWAAHFLLCYGATAVVCAGVADPAAPVESLRLGIAIVTLIAVLLILIVGWRAWRQWDYLDDQDYEHDLAYAEDRHEFLGHAAFLLAVVSLIGVVYQAMPALFIGSCL